MEKIWRFTAMIPGLEAWKRNFGNKYFLNSTEFVLLFFVVFFQHDKISPTRDYFRRLLSFQFSSPPLVIVWAVNRPIVSRANLKWNKERDSYQFLNTQRLKTTILALFELKNSTHSFLFSRSVFTFFSTSFYLSTPWQQEHTHLFITLISCCFSLLNSILQ